MKNTDELLGPIAQPELFSPDGHLTDSAFALLIQQQLDPLQSLEVSEHLSYCDQCLERYTAILCGEPDSVSCQDHLIEPPQPLLPGVLQRLRQGARVFYLKKAASLVVAASLALVFWSGGMFGTGTISGVLNNLVDGLQSSSQTLLEQTSELSQGFNDFFRSLQGNLLRWKYEATAPRAN